jgi:hypothetical protein
MGEEGEWMEELAGSRKGRRGSTSFIGAVVAGVAVCVVEEQGTEERRDAKD